MRIHGEIIKYFKTPPAHFYLTAEDFVIAVDPAAFLFVFLLPPLLAKKALAFHSCKNLI